MKKQDIWISDLSHTAAGISAATFPLGASFVFSGKISFMRSQTLSTVMEVIHFMCEQSGNLPSLKQGWHSMSSCIIMWLFSSGGAHWRGSVGPQIPIHGIPMEAAI